MSTAGSIQLCKDIATMETGRCSGFLIKTGELGVILLIGKLIDVRGGFQLSFLCDWKCPGKDCYKYKLIRQKSDF